MNDNVRVHMYIYEGVSLECMNDNVRVHMYIYEGVSVL